jgi:hypothetical protein
MDHWQITCPALEIAIFVHFKNQPEQFAFLWGFALR